MADITGTTKIGGVAIQTTVCCYDYVTKALVETKLTETDGTFIFTGLVLTTEYSIAYFQILGDFWGDSTLYTIGTLVRPVSSPTGFIYKCISEGTSGAIEPSWPTLLNETFSDGSALWKAQTYAVKPSANGPYFPV